MSLKPSLRGGDGKRPRSLVPVLHLDKSPKVVGWRPTGLSTVSVHHSVRSHDRQVLRRREERIMIGLYKKGPGHFVLINQSLTTSSSLVPDKMRRNRLICG